MVSHPKYRVYPSLLDKFQDLLDYEKIAEEDWNKVSESALAKGEYQGCEIGDYKLTPDEMYLKIESELIDSINRCPKEPSEAASKGTAFNEVVDCLIENRKSNREDCRIYSLTNEYGVKVIRAEIDGFSFDYDVNLCKQIAGMLDGSLTQYLIEAPIQTDYGEVEIYGYMDEWVGNEIIDLKTTSRYTFGKFEKKWQRHAYPYCAIKSGMATEVESFTYLVIEWAYQYKGTPLTASSVTPETYTYNHEDSTMKLRNHIETFIEWLESRREFITDNRIFGGENPEGYVGENVDIEKLKQNLYKETA